MFQVPIVDGTSLKEEPGILFGRGQQHDVPLITGGNSYEGSVMPGSGISLDEYAGWLGGDIGEARRLYADDFAVSEELGLKRMFGDNRYLLAARVLGDQMKQVTSSAWLYYIDFVSATQLTGENPPPGTRHGTDGYLMFAGHLLEEPDIRGVSQRLRAYWLNFARTGNPNGDDLVPWNPYFENGDCWLVFAHIDTMQCGLIAAKLSFIQDQYQKRTSGH